MKSKIINLNSNNIKIITRSLLIGKTIVIPTDTVYGIAADAKSFQAVSYTHLTLPTSPKV